MASPRNPKKQLRVRVAGHGALALRARLQSARPGNAGARQHEPFSLNGCSSRRARRRPAPNRAGRMIRNKAGAARRGHPTAAARARTGMPRPEQCMGRDWRAGTGGESCRMRASCAGRCGPVPPPPLSSLPAPAHAHAPSSNHAPNPHLISPPLPQPRPTAGRQAGCCPGIRQNGSSESRAAVRRRDLRRGAAPCGTGPALGQPAGRPAGRRHLVSLRRSRVNFC